MDIRETFLGLLVIIPLALLAAIFGVLLFFLQKALMKRNQWLLAFLIAAFEASVFWVIGIPMLIYTFIMWRKTKKE